jgi:hypothetical protein
MAAGGSTAIGGTTAAAGRPGPGSGGAGGQPATNGGAPGSAIVIADRWATGFSGSALGPVIASFVGSDEAAVAFIGWNVNEPNASELRVQHLDAKGVRTGAVIAKAISGSAGCPSMAASTSLYGICWDVAGQIECVSLAKGEDQLRPLYSGAGFAPIIVHGDSGWAIAWRASKEASTTIVLQQLGTQLTPIGVPVTFPSSNARPPDTSSSFAFAASGVGYVLVTGDPVQAQRLDGSLGVNGAPIDLKTKSFWSFSSLAAANYSIAFASGQPYGALLSVVSPSGQVTVASLPGGNKEGMPVGLGGDGFGIVGLWSSAADSAETWHIEKSLEYAPASVSAAGTGSWSFGSRIGMERFAGNYFAAVSPTGTEIQVLRTAQ